MSDPSSVLNQSFTLVDQYGDVFNTTLSELGTIYNDALVSAIVYAAQVGAAAVALVMLLVLTKAEKRRSPVFVLNSLALLFTFIWAILSCSYYTSSYYTPYASLSGDFSFVSSSAKVTSIVRPVINLLLAVCVYASLILQVHVVCVTLDRKRRSAVLALSLLLALVALSFQIAQSATSIEYNIIKSEWGYDKAWLHKWAQATQTVSIGVFSMVFCGKLGHSLLQRRSLGVTQFGPMQVIFIGGTQTLVIPVIFAILQFEFPATYIGSLVLTSTAISMPLTSLWASAITLRPARGTKDAQHPLKPIDEFSSGTDSTRGRGIVVSEVLSSGTGTGHGPLLGPEAYESTGSVKSHHSVVRVHSDATERDLEMQELGRR